MADVCMELSHGFCIPKVDLCHLSLNFFFSLSWSVFIVMGSPCSVELVEAASPNLYGACMEIDKTIDGCARHSCS